MFDDLCLCRQHMWKIHGGRAEREYSPTCITNQCGLFFCLSHYHLFSLTTHCHIFCRYWKTHYGPFSPFAPCFSLNELTRTTIFAKKNAAHLKAIEDEMFKRSIKGLIDVTIVRPGELIDADPMATAKSGVVRTYSYYPTKR